MQGDELLPDPNTDFLNSNFPENVLSVPDFRLSAPLFLNEQDVCPGWTTK